MRRGRLRRSDSLFVAQWVENERASARIGVAVGARAAGGAVRRNHVRRLIRESFRAHRQELPAVDVFLMARAGARLATNQEIFRSLERLWREIRSAR